MPRRLSKTFKPPTSSQVTDYLTRHFVTGPSRWVVWLPAMLLVAAVMLALTWTNPALTLLIWLVLIGLFVSAMVRARSMKQMEQSLASVQEFTLRRNHMQALRVVWRLIPQLRAQPQMHAKAVALLAHNLGHVQAYDASAIAFDHVIDKLPEDHPASVQLRVEQVMALLACDQLTDADRSLRRLRYVLDKFPNSVISAGFSLGELYQQVRTNHFQDILDNTAGVMDRLRPLGIDAAPGYAMIALACFHMRHTDAQLLTQAGTWWERASLLMAPAAMAERFEELATIQHGPLAAAKAAGDASPDIAADPAADIATDATQGGVS